MALRRHLVILAALTILPLLVFTTWTVLEMHREERARAERALTETARALRLAVDGELAATVAALDALATSRDLDAGNLRGFHAQASALRERHPGWTKIVLAELSGKEILNVRRPLGGPPAPTGSDPDDVRRVVATAKPVIGDAFVGPLSGSWVMAIRVPVVRSGQVRYVLTATVLTSELRDVLLGQRLSPEWIGTILDRNRLIVARTRGEDQFLGQPASERLLAASDRGSEGWYRGLTKEGTSTYSAFSRSPFTGITVALGVPSHLIEAPLERSLWRIAGSGVLVLALGIAVAVYFARRIAGPITDLSVAARDIGRGAPPRSAASAITEVNELRSAMGDAARLVRDERERQQAARAEAEAANTLKDEFLATLSHELRTPLNAVLGWARMLKTGSLDDPTAKRAIDVIERNAKSQLQLIEDLLDVSRIITGKLRLDVKAVAPTAVIEAAVDALRPAAEAKAIRLQPIVDPRAGPVSGDADRLQQIVWNLLSNAVKFTPRGGRVQIRVERVSSHVEIVVTDTGKGIPPEVLPHVFDRFRQADSSSQRSHGGLGIGLALVKSLVELHGGSVEAASAGPDQGATFTVKLPLMLHAESERAEPAGAGHRAAPMTSLGGISLLVLDDDTDALELFATVLRQAGAEVRVARSVREALDLLRAWEPDVIVSDIEMPEESGYAFIRKLRGEVAHGERIPAIAVTAYGGVNERIKIVSAGFDSYVAKPVEPDELAAIIGRLVARARTARRGREE
jgi:signal transduction histidine kinase/ActR/RegA family two-component response regulator